MNQKKLLRGRVLSFYKEPQAVDDHESYLYIEDGAILIHNGLIANVGEYGTLACQVRDNAEIIDHRPHLLLPGFIDPHIHFPQVRVIASWGLHLLDWLNTYTFPEEAKFANLPYATHMAKHFFDESLSHGTTTVAAFSSVHHGASEALFREAEKRNLRVIGGKVMMDRNAPDYLRDTPQSSYEDTKALIEAWHGKGRALYAISPRFAITSSPQQLEVAGALARQYPDCYVQTHLSETRDEIRLAAQLYPEARDYLDVYQHYGLVGRKSLFGHCLHLSEQERRKMAEAGSVAVFCPTSNLFLGSGLYDEEGLRASGVRTAIATDVGAGTSYSMLRTLDEGYKVLQLQSQKLNPLKAFYWITLGNARALELEGKIGTLESGTEADIVVLDSRATPLMALRLEAVSTLAEELFVLQTLGGKHAVMGAYIAGKPYGWP